MTIGELSQVLISTAALVSAVSALIIAVRGHAIASQASHAVNGQAEQINALREAKGYTEGMAAGLSADPTGGAPSAGAQIGAPTRG